MARAETNREFSRFVKGIITEANPLTFPPDASIDEDNFVLLRDGSRKRRLGIDFEDNAVETSTTFNLAGIDNLATSTFVWRAAGGNVNKSVLVVQTGLKLWFFNYFADPMTGSPFNSGNPITLTIGGGTTVMQFAQSGGDLLVANGNKKITRLIISASNVVTKTSNDVLIRDLFGIAESIAIDERPVSLSVNHNYNLLNQGWSQTAADATKTFEGVFPSNADIVHLGKATDETFNSKILFRQFFGTTNAPRGKAIIRAFDRGASRRTELGPGSLPLEATDSGLFTLASFAGRVFYSGSESKLTNGDDNSPLYSSFIFFSQVIENQDDAFKCYQEADPTSEHISDLVDDDGGFIIIDGATRILKMVPIGPSLVVIAENGIWAIQSADFGFKATEFVINKISESKVVGIDSVIQSDFGVFLWTDAGIIVVSPDPNTGILAETNLSENTIQTLFTNIEEISRKFARGIYDPTARQIRWLYSDDPAFDGVAFKYKYNRELVFDLVLQAFYRVKISDLPALTPFVSAYVVAPGINNVNQILNVTTLNGVNNVQANSGADEVVVTEIVASTGASAIKYLTYIQDATFQFTLSLQRNPDFLDWFAHNGQGLDAPAFMLTGHDTDGDTQRKKQSTYITVHLKATETNVVDTGGGVLDFDNPSSCLMQGQWGFANSSASGRFNNPAEVYKIKRLFITTGAGDPADTGFEVRTSKNKVRGKGIALSLLFSTSPKKDCHLLGWAINRTGATKP